MMQSILQLIEEHGLAVVFLNVLIEQAGAPIPAYPTLVITGALVEKSGYSAFALLSVAVFGALLADIGWYLAGRRYGRKMLSMLCRISLSPDSCVRQTESVYLRWGPPSLMVAKFIPGFASIASVLAGAVGTPKKSFLLFDLIGAALWAGSAIYLGSLFSAAVDELLSVLVSLGMLGALLLAMALFQGRIPGAIAMSEGETALNRIKEGEIIVYCDCPSEASAAAVSKRLMESGYSRVRPLAGGIDAWLAAGYEVETHFVPLQ